MSCNHICSIVPPILLERLCHCDEVDEDIRFSCKATLNIGKNFHEHRHDFFKDKCSHLHHENNSHGHQRSGHEHGQNGENKGPQGIIPGAFLQSVIDSSETSDETKAAAKENLVFSQQVRDDRAEAAAVAAGLAPEAKPSSKGSLDTETGFSRSVHDMRNTGDVDDPRTYKLLPGVDARLEGQEPTKDTTANEAYDMALEVLKFFKEKFNWDSLDGQAMNVRSSVHVGTKLGNAFWFGPYNQMVYGDGNNFLHNFTKCVDVIGHEMTHAVIQYNTALVYQDEAGALNEHISDAFGIMVKQQFENETAADADWLLGEGCLLPGVKGVALRSMKAPGTAYNDPRFGRDLQPEHMDQIPAIMEKYGDFIRDSDYGGVHVFSGIPNKAFYNASVAFGGYAWEKAGQIWWKVLSDRRISVNCTFVQFADATVDVADELYGDEAAKVVRDAWNQVGVVRKDVTAGSLDVKN
ncbi:protease PrtS [Podospora australis]|uniref:Protease PrtS n=1 Tax=Podospora australis TaxID=1536484 RepID=A0AAN7AF36_9PEZI|nr:protease PrtS [Podospora australis]